MTGKQHKQSGTTTYKSWVSMKQRCYNENAPDYRFYGAKGVAVCDRWLESFTNFLEDMGHRPDGTSLDRIDSTKDYEPDNCRWADSATQGRNKSSTLLLRVNGDAKTVREWSEQTGLSIHVIGTRYRRGDRGPDLIRPKNALSSKYRVAQDMGIDTREFA